MSSSDEFGKVVNSTITPPNKRKRGRPSNVSISKQLKDLMDIISSLTLEVKNSNKKINVLESELQNNLLEKNIDKEDKLIEIQKNNLYFLISNSINTLNAKENFKDILNYFRKFELACSKLSEQDKITILVSKLENKALLIFDNLNDTDKNDYEKIKTAILNSTQATNSRVTNQRSMFAGLKQKFGESFLDFSQRLLQTTTNSLLMGTPREVVEDLAKLQLLDNLSDKPFHSILVLRRDTTSYNQLVNEAISLLENCKENNPPERKLKTFYQNNEVVNKSLDRNLHVNQSRTSQNNKINLPCIFCNSQHTAPNCPNYINVNSRIKRLETLNRCSKCTKRGHLASSCFTRLHCTSCNSLHHHPYLCASKNTSSSRTFLVNDINSITEPNSIEISSNLTNSTTLSQVIKPSFKNNPVLLKCVKYEIYNPKIPSLKSSALILFDDGSTTSYISSQLVKALQLPSSGSEILKFNVFNETSPKSIKTDIVNFKIQTLTGMELNLSARSIDQIGAAVPHLIYSQLPSQIQNTTYGVPDILIGGDFYYDFNIAPVSTLPSGLSLLKSEIGPIVAGKNKDTVKQMNQLSLLILLSNIRLTISLI